MPFDDNKIMTFTDLKTLIDTEGFIERTVFPYTSLKGVTKVEALDALFISSINGIAIYLDNQLVPRILFESVPIGTICTVNDITTPIPDEINNTGVWSKDDANTTMGIGGGVNGVGGLYIIASNSLILLQNARKDFPLVKGREYNLSFYAKKTVGTNQEVLIEGNGFNDIINEITSSYIKYEVSGTATVNGYTQIEIRAKDLTIGDAGDDIFIDNILWEELPYDLYPIGNAASIGSSEANSVGQWAPEIDDIAKTTIQVIPPGTEGTYGIRILSTTSESVLDSAGAILPIEVKDNRTHTITFDAKLFISSTGAGSLKIRQDGLDIDSINITANNLWDSYSTTITTTHWDKMYLEFELLGHNGDYIDFDNFKIVQGPCV